MSATQLNSIQLPFEIDVTVHGDGCASLCSGLREHLVTDAASPSEAARVYGFVDGVESLITALAANGVDMRNPAVSLAIQDCIEAAGNQLFD